MKKILYSILRYQHSLLRDEIFNIGIIFYFPDMDNKIIFYQSPFVEKLRNLYPDMDYNTLTRYLNYINSSVKINKFEPQNDIPIDMSLKLFLKKYILLEDSTVLRFSDPVIISNIEPTTNHIDVLKNYIKILLSFGDNGDNNQIRNLIFS